jgi:hypothetical protein
MLYMLKWFKGRNGSTGWRISMEDEEKYKCHRIH